MGTPLGPKYIPRTYMDPLGLSELWAGGVRVQGLGLGVLGFGV